ncbi:Gfo/Idh/MocA family protein [Streptomyces gobiensis]|uniref:Gfo/Idh/MocA family protein n=1 Tax=Streptomyces gobiensis TaxID=2875706 RepID=UPI001E334840|nr:Gfo/Idh/MocA family oxidoreductase [Streptomyces gobiensis]UGY93006.1 Gfo/Idh/MocA family oxidoreductase [Streptomyces gobiensis]
MIRLGLIGCADIALRRVLPAVAATDGVRLAAVAARDRATAQRVADTFGTAAAGGYEDLLRRDDIDAVYVPLPPALHAEWVERALRHGKHVLAEKPLTDDPARTAELVALAESSGLVLRENFMFVRHGQHRRVRELLQDGAIGDPHTMTAVFAIPPRPPDDIRLRPDLGGGALLDVGGYPVRAAQLLLGDGLGVVGARLRHDQATGVDLAGTALLSREDGVTAQLTFGMDHHYASGYELYGSAGRLRLDHAFTPPADHRPVVRLDRGGTERLVLAAEDQVGASVAAFVRAVLEKDTTADPAIVRQAHLIAAIRRCAGIPLHAPWRQK